MQGAVLEESKSALRKAMISLRISLSSATCLSWSRSIQAQAVRFRPYLDADEVALYSPIENEAGTNEILAHALDCKKKVFYPRIGDQDSAGFFEVFSAADLRPRRFGVPEPPATKTLSRFDRRNLIVFVPGVAFDIGGFRLGRGGGWYDRMLEALEDRGVFVGLAYEFQVVDQLATETWDRKVHYVVTEKRIIACDVSTP